MSYIVSYRDWKGRGDFSPFPRIVWEVNIIELKLKLNFMSSKIIQSCT